MIEGLTPPKGTTLECQGGWAPGESTLHITIISHVNNRHLEAKTATQGRGVPSTIWGFPVISLIFTFPASFPDQSFVEGGGLQEGLKCDLRRRGASRWGPELQQVWPWTTG